ncbi:MAG: hypothetical protein M2R45_03647 [Verrucomicrobia subdivision 3 bacterium]|nr:hypothetical protein [Limisphaerales bacterium]MCS1412723.1 hypothetical protein [Limisphaerales bacterium]
MSFLAFALVRLAPGGPFDRERATASLADPLTGSFVAENLFQIPGIDVFSSKALSASTIP